MNKFRKQSFLGEFYASDNQDKRKIQTENKTHQDKKNLKSTLYNSCKIFSASKHPLKFLKSVSCF